MVFQMLVNETAMSLYPQFFVGQVFWKKNMEDFHDSKTLNKHKSLQPKKKPMTLSKYIDFEDIFLYNAMGASFFEPFLLWNPLPGPSRLGANSSRRDGKLTHV